MKGKEDGQAPEIVPVNVKFLKAASEGPGGDGAAGKAKKEGEPKENGEEKVADMHPTTVFVSGLINWSGGEGDLREAFETQLPGAKVQVR